MRSQDIAIVGILLAVGAIARFFAAIFIPGPIVPNFIIIFYCLAIMLIIPKFKEALGIGIVAGIISALITHSIFPPANLISEPIGALVCLAVFISIRKHAVIAPALSTLVATIASGTVFVLVVMAIVMVAPTLLYKEFSYDSLSAFFATMFIMIVVPTAILNTIVAQILYIPSARVLSRGK